VRIYYRGRSHPQRDEIAKGTRFRRSARLYPEVCTAEISGRIPALWSGSDKKGPEMCARNGRTRQGAEDQDARRRAAARVCNPL